MIIPLYFTFFAIIESIRVIPASAPCQLPSPSLDGGLLSTPLAPDASVFPAGTVIVYKCEADPKISNEATCVGGSWRLYGTCKEGVRDLKKPTYFS